MNYREKSILWKTKRPTGETELRILFKTGKKGSWKNTNRKSTISKTSFFFINKTTRVWNNNCSKKNKHSLNPNKVTSTSSRYSNKNTVLHPLPRIIISRLKLKKIQSRELMLPLKLLFNVTNAEKSAILRDTLLAKAFQYKQLKTRGNLLITKPKVSLLDLWTKIQKFWWHKKSKKPLKL